MKRLGWVAGLSCAALVSLALAGGAWAQEEGAAPGGDKPAPAEAAAEKKADAYSYACPCYANPKRGGLNFIFTVDLRSEDPPQKWILRGVALLASTA